MSPPTQPAWRMKELAEALGALMVRGVLGKSHLAALIAYWERRGELGPYPRDDHGHRRFGEADLAAIRARITRWHAQDVARAVKYRALPRAERERGWTRKAERRHLVEGHRGPFDVCDRRGCAPHTPKWVAYRADVEARIAAAESGG